MAVSYFVVVALFLLEVSTEAAAGKVRVKFCEEARMEGAQYPPIEAKCCRDLEACDKYIGPNETRYGVTNTDPVWPIRPCSWEVDFINCVIKNLTPYERAYVRANSGLDNLKCLWRRPNSRVNGASEEFEIRAVQDVLSLLTPQHPFAWKRNSGE